MTEREPLFQKLKIGRHQCSLDIEAYECPICWRNTEDEEEQLQSSTEDCTLVEQESVPEHVL